MFFHSLTFMQFIDFYFLFSFLAFSLYACQHGVEGTLEASAHRRTLIDDLSETALVCVDATNYNRANAVSGDDDDDASSSSSSSSSSSRRHRHPASTSTSSSSASSSSSLVTSGAVAARLAAQYAPRACARDTIKATAAFGVIEWLPAVTDAPLRRAIGGRIATGAMPHLRTRASTECLSLLCCLQTACLKS